MITKITGELIALSETEAYFAIDHFEYEVLIPEFTRRQIQLQIGQQVSLHTINYIEGNPQSGSRMNPRLIGFVSPIERQFFDLFCSVDGVGVKKALRAMVRPVPEIANAIENQDVKTLATLPGIGAATAERIVAKLRRKMAKFALLVAQQGWEQAVPSEETSVFDETYQVLIALGHSETDARKLLEGLSQTKKKFTSVEALLQAVYENSNR